MITCPNCNHDNREGLLFCINCGYSITDAMVGQATIPTRRVESDPDESSAKSTWGSARFRQGSTIILHIHEAAEPVTIEPAQRIIFGRSDNNSTYLPDVDFAPYGALEKGVSRQHAALEINEDTLMLLDVGSSNGTFLNGQRLLPNQPRVLRDGDEVRLGKLITHIYFK
jgi:pSer/pThr/pTyr-binding forkhead associated (FHA) protein